MSKNSASKWQKISSSSTDRNRSKGFVRFLILTYVLTFLTWGMMVIFQLPGASVNDTDMPPSAVGLILFLLGGLSPSISGVIMTWRMKGRAGLRDLWKRFTQFNIGITWYLIILVIPMMVQVVRMVVFTLRGGSFVRPEFLEQPVNLIPMIIILFIFGPLSEEFGWRGFAQDRIQARWGKIQGSLILGLVWSVWHLSLFFIPGSNQQGDNLVLFAVQVISWTLFFTWIYNNTNRSLWAAVFFHFSIPLSEMFFEFAGGAGDVEYLAGIITWAVLAVIVTIFTRDKKQVAFSKSS